MTEELKPCPAGHPSACIVSNTKVGVHLTVTEYYGERSCGWRSPIRYQSAEGAAIAWNARAESAEVARLKARIVELEAIVDELDFEQCTHPDGLGIGVDFKGRHYCRLRDEA